MPVLILGAVAGAVAICAVLVRLLPTAFRARMQEGWRPWVWVPAGVALTLYGTAMVGTWVGAARGDGWCLSERPGADWHSIDVRAEKKWLPPFITCVYSDGMRIDAGGRG